MNDTIQRIYLLTSQDDKYRQLISDKNLPQLEFCASPQQANIVLADPPLAALQLHELSNLQWLQSTFAGVNALLAEGCRQDYLLTNVRDIFGPSITEYVLGYSISHFRHFRRYQQQQQECQWQGYDYANLSRKVMVILGTGSIGSYLAHSAQALGLTVHGVNSTGIPGSDNTFNRTYHINELASALAHADIIVNTLPDTPATRGLLNEETLQYCHNALLFNVGRGPTLDEKSLLVALKNKWIEHAFLDVFTTEPLPATHPFWQLRQITITPHIAALSFPEQIVDIFAENYQRWQDGFKLNYLIDFEKGY